MVKTRSNIVCVHLGLALKCVASTCRKASFNNSLHHEVNKLNNFNWPEWSGLEPGSVTMARIKVSGWKA